MGKYGKTAPDGSVEVEANECPLTGRFVEPENSVRVRVTGTPFFFRIVKGQNDRMTPELREQWEMEAKAAFNWMPVGGLVQGGGLAKIHTPESILPTKPSSRTKTGEGE